MIKHRMLAIYPSLMNNDLRKLRPRIVEKLTYNVIYIFHQYFNNKGIR